MPENCSVDLFLMILLNVILKNRAEQNRTNLESFLVYIILDVVVLVRPRNWENLNSVHELKQEERNRERERDGDVRRSQEEKQSSCVSCKSRDSRVSVLSHWERWKKERERLREMGYRRRRRWCELCSSLFFVCEPRRKVRENVVSVCYREASSHRGYKYEERVCVR